MQKSIYSNNLQAQYYFPGIEVINVEPGMSPHELLDFVSNELVLPERYTELGEQLPPQQAIGVGSTKILRRDHQKPHEDWHPDYYWHTDRLHFGANFFAAVLYAAELKGPAAPTGLIDTEKLLDQLRADNPLVAESLEEARTIYTALRYYQELLAPENASHYFDYYGASSFEELLRNVDKKYPPLEKKTIQPHPVTGNDALLFSQGHVSGFLGIDPDKSRMIRDYIVTEYLDLGAEELSERDYFAVHEWEPGDILFLPQVGSIHRSYPSPEGEELRLMLRTAI